MKKTVRLLGTFAIAALAAFIMASCGGGGAGGGAGGGGSSSPFDGTYSYPPSPATFTISGSTGTYRNWTEMPAGQQNGTTPGSVGTRAGGTLSGSVTGEWVYLTVNGNNEGIIMHCTPAMNGGSYWIGISHPTGNTITGTGAPLLVVMAETAGITFTPRPNFTGFTPDLWFVGRK